MSNDFFIHTADLQIYSEGQNEAGQTKKGWNNFITGIPCYIRAMNGNEIIAAEKAGFSSTYRMYCDKNISPKQTDRIISGGRTFEITFLNGQIGTHWQIDLKVVE